MRHRFSAEEVEEDEDLKIGYKKSSGNGFGFVKHESGLLSPSFSSIFVFTFIYLAQLFIPRVAEPKTWEGTTRQAQTETLLNFLFHATIYTG